MTILSCIYNSLDRYFMLGGGFVLLWLLWKGRGCGQEMWASRFQAPHPAAGHRLSPGLWQSSFAALVSGLRQSHLRHRGSGATKGEMPPWAGAALALGVFGSARGSASPRTESSFL